MDIEERPFSEKALEGIERGEVITITAEQRLFQAIVWGRWMLQQKIRVESTGAEPDRIAIDYGR